LHLAFERDVNGVECVTDFAAAAREFTCDLGGAFLCRVTAVLMADSPTKMSRRWLKERARRRNRPRL
jgi:hypothetical protein